MCLARLGASLVMLHSTRLDVMRVWCWLQCTGLHKLLLAVACRAHWHGEVLGRCTRAACTIASASVMSCVQHAACLLCSCVQAVAVWSEVAAGAFGSSLTDAFAVWLVLLLACGL